MNFKSNIALTGKINLKKKKSLQQYKSSYEEKSTSRMKKLFHEKFFLLKSNEECPIK